MGFRASPLVLTLLWLGFRVLAAPGLSTPGHVAWQWPPWARPCLPPSSSQHKMCERPTFLSDQANLLSLPKKNSSGGDECAPDAPWVVLTAPPQRSCWTPGSAEAPPPSDKVGFVYSAHRAYQDSQGVPHACDHPREQGWLQGHLAPQPKAPRAPSRSRGLGHSVLWGAELGCPRTQPPRPREHPLSREGQGSVPVLGTDDGGPESAMPHAPARR